MKTTYPKKKLQYPINNPCRFFIIFQEHFNFMMGLTCIFVNWVSSFFLDFKTSSQETITQHKCPILLSEGRRSIGVGGLLFTFFLLPRRLQPRKQASLQKTQNTQWNDNTKHAFTPNFCIYVPKELQVSQLPNCKNKTIAP